MVRKKLKKLKKMEKKNCIKDKVKELQKKRDELCQESKLILSKIAPLEKELLKIRQERFDLMDKINELLIPKKNN